MTSDRNKPEANTGRYVIVSLGCKVNQAEEAHLASELEKRGLSPAPEGAPGEVAVLVTCSVTAAAARQSRQMARRLARTHQGGRIIVTGCDAQAEPEAYHAEGLEVAGRSLMKDLPEIIARGRALPDSPPLRPEDGPWCPGQRAPLPGKSRGLLKVQDGCDAFCAYCIVPYTRGRPRSLPPDPAAKAFAELGRAGAREVVLTGIHLGRYGRDLDPEFGLASLVKSLLLAHPMPRVRLSSLEVNEITPELVELLIAEDRLCRHLHIPLQSGSDRVLKAMGRPYRTQQFAGMVTRLAEEIPGVCLGADVLVGLPGEDENAFEETKALLKGLPISYLHVFPYSPRPGTRAAAMTGRPDGKTVKQRAARLRELGRVKREAFWQSQVGQTLRGVTEQDGRARSDNYCLVKLDRELPPARDVLLEVTEMIHTGQGAELRGQVRQGKQESL